MPFLDYTGLTSFWNKIKVILAGKQNSLTVGEGISLENNTISLQEPVKGVTQEEYNALSNEEKNVGLYIVTDANINLNDFGDFYSTEETRVGTWADGKPLYRRVVIGTTGAINKFAPIIKIENITLKNAYGSIYRTDNVISIVPDMKNSVLRSGDNISVYTNLEVCANAPIELVIEYTKTTDAASTFSSLSTQNLSVNSLNSVSQSSEKVLTSKVPLPSSETYAPASAVSTSISFAPASAASAKLEL